MLAAAETTGWRRFASGRAAAAALDAAARAEIEAELASVRERVECGGDPGRGDPGRTGRRDDFRASTSIRADAIAGALLVEQRALREELARETAANPLGNPRVAEIRARLADVDAALEAAAERIVAGLDAEAERGREQATDLARRLSDADAAAAAATELARSRRRPRRFVRGSMMS